LGPGLYWPFKPNLFILNFEVTIGLKEGENEYLNGIYIFKVYYFVSGKNNNDGS
jgi:hypothetical protein